MTLVDFIVKAKLSGYASDTEGQEVYFEDGSKGFELTSDGYKYLDRYNGFNPFSGYEHVYKPDNTLIWVMNYYGEVLPNCSDPKSIYSFLKEAMLLVNTEYPFRGPAQLESKKYRYANHQNGSLDCFHGIESIYENEEKVYVLYYHGGKL